MKIYNNSLVSSFTNKLFFSVCLVLGSVIFPGTQTASVDFDQNATLLLLENTSDDVMLTPVNSSIDSAFTKTSENYFYDSFEANWKKEENFNAEFQLNSASTLTSVNEDLNFSAIAISSTELIPAGSYVIAMDDALQGGDNFNLKAYGLVVRLLHAGIPLKWAIKSNKAKDGTDFWAPASRIKPSSQSSQARDFKSGPIIVYPGFESQALTVINSFGNNVYVYQTTESRNVEIYSDLTHKPKAAVFSDGGKDDIHTDIYSDAGLTSGTHYNAVSNSSSIMNANSCYTFASEPHSNHSDTNKKNNVESFLRSGGNFLAQCHGVESYTKLGLLAGYSDKNNGGSETYSNHSQPFAQFIGNLPDEGGSVKDFRLTSNPGLNIISRPSDYYVAYVGKISGVTTTNGGYVHYLGGHDHSDVNGKRLLLNALLTPADRPNNCNLNFTHTALGDTGSINGCGDTETINVLSNDSNPLNENLTVSLVGTGTHGDFVNNGNGTITYTMTDAFFSGSDSINYNLCNSNNTCSQAIITVNGPSSLKIGGNVFLDVDEDGVLDNGESGQSGVTIKLYRDNNQNGSYDAGDDFIENATTNSNGEYNFNINLSNAGGTTTITSSKSSLIYKGDGNKNYGNDNYLEISNYNNYNTYSLIEFDLNQLPQGCSIQSAILKVFHKDGGGGGNSFNFNARKVLNSWNEGSVTWNNFGSSNIGATNYDTETGQNSDSDGKEYAFDIKNLVTDWINNNSNNGVALVPSISNSNSYFAMHSDDSSSQSLRPKLELVTYCNVNDYLAVIDETSLPQGSSLTSNSSITFNFSANGQISCSNNFGFDIACDADADNTTATASITEGQTKNLTGNPSGGSWSIVSGGGSITGSTYTPANINTNTTVKIRYTIAADGSCAATTDDVTFTVTPVCDVVADNTTTTALITEGQTKNLTGNPPGGTWSHCVWRWFYYRFNIYSC